MATVQICIMCVICQEINRGWNLARTFGDSVNTVIRPILEPRTETIFVLATKSDWRQIDASFVAEL